MNIDPRRLVMVTVPFGMIEELKRAQPILSMFRDEIEVRNMIDIIDAIYASAVDYIREEEGEIEDFFDEEGQSLFESLNEEDDKS